MNFKNIAKVLVVGAFASVLVSTTDKIERRPTGTYPTPKRLVVVTAAAVALNYGGAYLERKLGLTDKNSRFPFKD